LDVERQAGLGNETAEKNPVEVVTREVYDFSGPVPQVR